MGEATLKFKGRKEGLFAVARGFEDFGSFLNEIDIKLTLAGHFFAGACLAGVYGIFIDDEQELILCKTIEDKHGMKVRKPLIKNRKKYPRTFEGLEEGITRITQSTLRSGQRIYYEGNVVILGDINPGAEIEAGGNIVVMGALRGIARAGMPDNQKAFIAANVLQPTQLWIGGIAARWPEKQEIYPCAEKAYVEDGKMYIKPFSSKKINRA